MVAVVKPLLERNVQSNVTKTLAIVRSRSYFWLGPPPSRYDAADLPTTIFCQPITTASSYAFTCVLGVRSAEWQFWSLRWLIYI